MTIKVIAQHRELKLGKPPGKKFVMRDNNIGDDNTGSDDNQGGGLEWSSGT